MILLMVLIPKSSTVEVSEICLAWSYVENMVALFVFLLALKKTKNFYKYMCCQGSIDIFQGHRKLQRKQKPMRKDSVLDDNNIIKKKNSLRRRTK